MFLISSCTSLWLIHWSQVGNEDVVGAAPTGDAPTTSEWSTVLLPIEVRLKLEVWRYIHVTLYVNGALGTGEHTKDREFFISNTIK